MMLRWLVVCDADGQKTEPELQYWNETLRLWTPVGWVECKEHEVHSYNSDKRRW